MRALQSKKEPIVSKTPNLVQRPTGPTIYAPMKLPPVVQVPFTGNSGLPSRINQSTPAAPVVGNPAPARPLGSTTNTVNQVRK
jgi:hypothetical protein